jgi:Na+/H+ antiporter NhaD/arsenite permease-like protein
MIPVVKELQAEAHANGDDAYWWSLALGACFGGNATMIAAAANVAAAGMAERAGTPIGFLNFLKIGLPATIISIALATGYIAIRYILL